LNIPWRLKSSAYAVIDVVGDAPLYFAQKHITRRAAPRGMEINPNWLFHQRVLRESRAKRVIEFGAGKDLVQNLFLAQDEIEQVVVDLFEQLDTDLVNRAIDNLKASGVPTKGHVTDRADLRARYRIEYIAPLNMVSTPFQNASFAACISTNTLEHIPKDVIEGIWRECFRIIANGGVVSSKIDYSDHYAHTDKSIGLLNYLTFSDKHWERFNHKNHFQNRLRHQHHIELLRDAGFEIVSDEAFNYEPAPSGVLNRNLTGASTDFATAGFMVARKL